MINSAILLINFIKPSKPRFLKKYSRRDSSNRHILEETAIFFPLVMLEHNQFHSKIKFTTLENYRLIYDGYNRSPSTAKNLSGIRKDDIQILFNKKKLHNENFKLEFQGESSENFFIEFDPKIFNFDSTKIQKIIFSILIKNSTYPMYFQNSSMEIYSPDIGTLFGQSRINSNFPRIINGLVWVLNFLAITKNSKYFLRALQRTWLLGLLPVKYPINFALYISNFFSYNIEELTIKKNTCLTNPEYGCLYTHGNRFLIMNKYRNGRIAKNFVFILALVGSSIMSLINRNKDKCRRVLTVIFFWMRASVEFNNFTYYCIVVFCILFPQKGSAFILFPIVVSLIMGSTLLFTNRFYEILGLNNYKIPYSKSVRFRENLVEILNVEKEENTEKSESWGMSEDARSGFKFEMSEEEERKLSKKKKIIKNNFQKRKEIEKNELSNNKGNDSLKFMGNSEEAPASNGKRPKGILKIKSVPREKSELLTIELFKRLAFSISLDNFKIVPFNLLINIKTLISVFLVVLLKYYPILCCFGYLGIQFGMTYVWLKCNKDLIHYFQKRRIWIEMIYESIIDLLVFLPTLISVLSYSYLYGVLLQVIHFSYLIFKFFCFIEGIYSEIRMLKARRKSVGGLEKLKYHEKMDFGFIKYKMKFLQEKYREQDLREEEMDRRSKFLNLRNCDRSKKKPKIEKQKEKLIPLQIKRRGSRRKIEALKVLKKIDKKVEEERSFRGMENSNLIHLKFNLVEVKPKISLMEEGFRIETEKKKREAKENSEAQ